MTAEQATQLLTLLARIANALEKIAGRSGFEQIFGK